VDGFSVDEELRLQDGLVQAVRLAEGWNAAGTAEATEVLRKLADRCQDRALAERTLFDLWSPVMVSGDITGALRLAEDLHEMATGRDDPVLIARASMCLSISLMNGGRPVDAISAARAALTVKLSDGTAALSPFEQLYVRQSGGNCTAISSADPATELPEWTEPLMDVIESGGDAISVMMAYLGLCTIWTMADDVPTAGRFGEALLPMAEAAALAPFVAFAKLAAGYARFVAGDRDGIVLHQEGMDELQRQSMALGRTNFLAQQGKMRTALGDLDGARSALDEGFSLVEILTEPHYIANLWRARAALAVAEGAGPSEIDRCFDAAQAVTERFGLLPIALTIEAERAQALSSASSTRRWTTATSATDGD
jgi:hypothetical protein